MSESNKALERLKQKRQQDVRRKILIGAYYLEQAQQTGMYQQLVEQLNPFLTRPSDRKLFGLAEQTTPLTPVLIEPD